MGGGGGGAMGENWESWRQLSMAMIVEVFILF